jgi:hypothetical protein
VPPIDPAIYGPFGALVLATIAAGLLWREHVAADRRRRDEYASTVAFERDRTKAAEIRLDNVRETMKDALDVLERSVSITERTIGRR